MTSLEANLLDLVLILTGAALIMTGAVVCVGIYSLTKNRK
jgi:hypothetical protein